MNRKIIIFLIFSLVFTLFQGCDDTDPKSAFNSYIESWESQDYEKMYKLLEKESQEKYAKDVFIERYENIYSGIEVSEVKIEADYSEKLEKEDGYTLIPFTAKIETKAGEIKFTHNAKFIKESEDGEEEWKMSWDSSMIFSDLEDGEKIRIVETTGYRGAIYDRNENPLAISDQQGNREYPNGIVSGHLTGYVRQVTAEDLEEHEGEGYSETDLIGKTGLEKEFEDILRPKNGAEIYVEDAEGNKKKVLANKEVEDGKNVKLTIDIDVQNTLYEQMKGEEGAGIVMSPKDGQVYGLVSTPSYDPQKFVSGMSTEEWDALNNDPDKPLTNRYTGAYAPGSTFKTITAAIGLDTGKLDPDYNRNISGLQWKKSSWGGNSYVTRAHGYSGPSNLRNGLVYSDNIYFAQVALDIGATLFTEGAQKFGIGDVLDFDITVRDSQIANESIADEGQLAHTAYGQAEVLMNPLHLVSIYSFLVNEGNVIKPQLVLSDDYEAEFLKEGVCSAENTNLIKTDLEQVVSDSGGTAHSAQLSNVTLAGKTGTAEIKASTDDTSGTETGWFIAVDSKDAKYSVGIMIENVKDRGGSGLVVPLVKNVFQSLY
jgi:penicillin-binding protein